MRPVLPGDVSALARVVLPLPAPERARRIAGALEAAELADAHRRRTGRAHPVLGTGSVMAAVASCPKIDEPDFDDEAWCRCWIEVLEALLRHRARRAAQPEAQATQSGSVGSRSSRLSGMSSPQSRHSP